MSLQCLSSSNASVVNQSALVQQIQTVSRIVYPAELALGFLCQILNLVVLHGQRIRSIRYTIYLRALSINYLLAIPFFIPNLLRKNNVFHPDSYFVLFYFARIDTFVLNLFLFSSNLMVAALAVEPLRAIVWPMSSLVVSSRRPSLVLTSIYLSTALILVPVVLFKGVERVSDSPVYCIQERTEEWPTYVRYVNAAVFEVSLLVAVICIYGCLLCRYRRIVVKHRKSVRKLAVTPSRALLNKNRKAVVICFGSVTAYLLSNLLSAIKETIKFASFLSNNTSLVRNDSFLILIQIANLALLSNYALTFLLQYAISSQYRNQLHKILGVRRLSGNFHHSYNLRTNKTTSEAMT